MPNGKFELGDWPARKHPDWINWTWLATLTCGFGCASCIGFARKPENSPPTLIDKYGIDGCVSRFEKLRDQTKKNIYITMSGGEPTMIKLLPQFCREMTKRNFVMELHTNLTTPNFKKWANYVDPANIGQVMATYHSWRLEKEEFARNLYLDNFKHGWDLGLTMVCKNIVMPNEAATVDKKLEYLQSQLPKGAPVLLWGYIHGSPTSTTNFNKAFPYSYTAEQKELLYKTRQYRVGDQKAYMMGAGFSKGMQCSAGESYLYMSVHGEIYRCYGCRKIGSMGDFGKAQINLQKGTEVCVRNYCSTPFWQLWYGKDPWNYVPGLKEEDCDFCKHKAWEGKLPMYPKFKK